MKCNYIVLLIGVALTVVGLLGIFATSGTVKNSENVNNNINISAIDCSQVHGYIVASCVGNSSTYVGENPSYSNAASYAVSTNSLASAKYTP